VTATAMILNTKTTIMDIFNVKRYQSRFSPYNHAWYSYIHHNICAGWVPKLLTDDHKCNHLDTRSHLLQQHHNEEENYLYHISTGNQTCIHHYDPEITLQSVWWNHPTSSSPKKFRTQPPARKVIYGYRVLGL
jgi:hypothetical protein